MNSFDRFYRLRFNSADVRYDYPWMPDIPAYAVPTHVYSTRCACALDIGSGAIVDANGNAILTPSALQNVDRAYSRILTRLFGTSIDIDEVRNDIDALAIDVLKEAIDLSGCRITPIDRRPQAFGPRNVLVTDQNGDQAVLTFRRCGVWQSVRYLSPTLILDPFGAIDPATAASLIRFYPPYMEDDE